MLGLVVLGTVLATVNAIVCIPELCEGVAQTPLKCAGSVIKGGGFCGCSDVCAKVEGETCQARAMFGMIPAGTCDTGLICQEHALMALGRGSCVKQTSLRSVQTKCEQMRITAMITMIIYAGKWTANCDADGNFLPMQCDRSGHCFCVNADGEIQGDRVMGKVTCPSIN